jgi:hypothetical protein
MVDAGLGPWAGEVAVVRWPRRSGMWVVAAAVLAGACGGSAPRAGSSAVQPSASTLAMARVATATRAAPLVVPVADAHCPNGRGIGINTKEWTSGAAQEGSDDPGLAAAMLPHGDTLVVASGAPSPRTAIAAEFRGPCALNRAFGHGGVIKLTLQKRGVSIAAVLPTGGGGAILAGSTRHAWLVGKLTADGQPDQGFGDHGWTRLPWHGQISSVARTGRGDLVLGGDDRPNTNGQSMVSEVTAHGKLVTGFGVHGRAAMPGYHDGGIDRVLAEPDGDILALLGGGNMGCWGVTAITLTSAGHRVQGFTHRFLNALSTLDKSSVCPTPVFVGDIEAGPTGFHLLGTSQGTCVDGGCTNHPSGKPDPSRGVRDVAFHYDGDLDTAFGTAGQTSFRAPMAEAAWILPEARGRAVLGTNPAADLYRRARAHLFLYGITSAGHLNASHADRGVARIPLPYKTNDDSFPLDYGLTLPVSDGRQTVIVTNQAPGSTVVLIRPSRSD